NTPIFCCLYTRHFQNPPSFPTRRSSDLAKVVRHRNLGLYAWQKLILQFLVTGCFMAGLYSLGLCSTTIMLPFFGAVNLGQSPRLDRKSTRLNSSHVSNSYAVFCLKNKII